MEKLVIYAISDVSYVYQQPIYRKDWYFRSYFEAVEYAKDLLAMDCGSAFESKRLITKTIGNITYIQYKGCEGLVASYYAVEAIEIR